MILCHVSPRSSFSALSLLPLNLFYLLFCFFFLFVLFLSLFHSLFFEFFSSVLTVLPFSAVPLCPCFRRCVLTICILFFVLFLSSFPLEPRSSASGEFVLSTFVKGNKPSLHLIFVVFRALNYWHHQVLKALKGNKSNNKSSNNNFCILFIRLKESLG